MRTGPAIAIALATAILGCREKAPRPDPGPDPVAPTANSADAGLPTVIPSTLRVALLDSGEAPRAPLRYGFSIGDKQVVILRLRYTANNRLRAAAPSTLVFPHIKLVFHVEVVEALRGDRVRYRFDLGEASLTDVSGADRRIVASAEEALKKAQGIRGSAVVDSRGVIRDGTIDIPRQLDPSVQIMIDSMRSSMEQLSVPLPEEAVGIGARWELAQTLVQGGTTIDQTTSYELVSNKKGTIEVRGTIEQNATRQDVELAGFEFAELISLRATGKATTVFSAARLAPLRASYALESEGRYEFARKSKRRRALITTGSAEIDILSQ